MSERISIMDTFFSVYYLRAFDATMAILIAIIFQHTLCRVLDVFKIKLPPMPFLEIILRPIIIFFCDKLNRHGRSDFSLVVRGAIVFLVILAMVGMPVIIYAYLAQQGSYIVYTDIFILMFVLSPFEIISPAYAISKSDPAKGQYRNIAQSLNVNMIPSDEFGLRRLAVKAMMVGYTDWLIAPVLFYLIGGVPLACMFVALSYFIRINAHQRDAFQSIFFYLYKVFNFIAGIVVCFLIAVSSIFTAGGRPLNAVKAIRMHGVNSIAVMAYTQNITLGGVIQNRHGEKIDQPWTGPDGTSAKITQKDVLRVVIHYYVMVFVTVACLFAIYVYG